MAKKPGHKEREPILTQEKKIAFTAIEQQIDELNRIGENIWRFNEPGGKEFKSCALIVDFLKRKGFRVQDNYLGFPTAFRAEYSPGDPDAIEHPNIGFLCQYDADPVKGIHTRGNNLQTTVSLAAALGLQTVIKFAMEKLGKLTVLGCPGNQDNTGKVFLLDAGGFKGIDFLLLAYPANYTNLQPRFIGSQTHKITYRGRSRQESDRPWDVANPVNAAVLAYQNIAGIRHQFPPEWIVKGVISEGGSRPDIMPYQTCMEFLLKAPKPMEMKVLGELLNRCFEAAGTASGCTVETQPMMKEFLVNVASRRLAELYKYNANLMGYTFHNESSKMEAENDIANVSTSIPTLTVFYYAATSAEVGTDEFGRFAGTTDGEFMSIVQGKALAMMAIDLITSEDAMRQVFEEHQADFINKYEGICDVVVAEKTECEHGDDHAV